MKIYLIRHGETVDNVAGLYAGVRDSQLTNYGVDQTKRLGENFASKNVVFTHIYASTLTRAYETAEAIRTEQTNVAAAREVGHKIPDVVKVPELIEQDFGYYEGKPWYTRTSSKKTGRESHAQDHRNDPGFVDIETKESMGRRADTFLEIHLLPLLGGTSANDLVIAIVSHGMLLSTLWRRMLRRMMPESVIVAPEITATRGAVVLEHLGGWGNTGYLELELLRPVQSIQPRVGAMDDQQLKTPLPDSSPDIPLVPDEESSADDRPRRTPEATSSPEYAVVPGRFDGYKVSIVSIDNKSHLVGLKRQRGGIGRLAHDVSQRKLDTFFKKPKVG